VFDTIVFYVGDKHLGLYGREYLLGELTTEMLNIPRDEYYQMRKTLEKAQACLVSYQKSKDMQDWFNANEYFISLDDMMCRHRIFRLLKNNAAVLSDARELTSQFSLFQEEDYCMGDYDHEVQDQIREYENYLEHPEEYGGVNTATLTSLQNGKTFTLTAPQPDIPPVPPPKTRALLITPGELNLKWARYLKYTSMYKHVLLDVDSLNYTIKNFIRFSLSNLEQLNANNYIAALNEFLFHERSYKLVANPISGTGNYTSSDTVQMHHIPRETAPGSGVFKVYEYYEVDTFQTLIKLDFYKALEAGHIIRRCECCDRCFLLQKGYRTKYCDMPNPDDPKHTCQQIGYSRRKVKEAADDSPLTQSLRRCHQRIDKDLSRGHITEKDKDRLYRISNDLYHRAKTRGTSYDEFESSLASENLYPLCGVQRKTKPRGRPKRSQ
jgi:hypothetical protein